MNNLEIYEDNENHTNHKKDLSDSIMEFLKTKNTDSAHKVYETFFIAYWIGIQHENNPFLELPQNMKKFEENAGCLIKGHRDHYIHTVFVFLLGIAIYETNDNFKESFNEYALNKKKYPDSYDTPNEEFFYRWGLASLFHDIAYPLEITLKQANKYLDFIWSYPEDADRKGKIKMDLSHFEDFILLPVLEPNTEPKHKFFEKYPDFKPPIDARSILSKSISNNFSLEFDKVEGELIDFVEHMKEDSFIDHGFYSALIMLRWHHYLVETAKWNPAYFYFPVADSASAIFLHNYYKYGLMKEPFNLKCMKVKSHPIAYLLILCDGLQEWDRKGFSEEDLIAPTTTTNFDVVINNLKMEIHYKLDEKDGNHIFKDVPKRLSEVIQISDLFAEEIIVK